MKSNLTSIAALIIIVAVLAGCGGDETNTSYSSNATEGSKSVVKKNLDEKQRLDRWEANLIERMKKLEKKQESLNGDSMTDYEKMALNEMIIEELNSIKTEMDQWQKASNKWKLYNE